MEQFLKELHDVTDLTEIRVFKRNFIAPELSASPSLFDRYRYNINITHELDLQANMIIKDILIHLVTVKEPPATLAEVKVQFHFHIRDLQGKMKAWDNDRNQLLNEWLDNVILATTRGIMYAEFRGTFLDKAILPITNPSNIRKI